MIRSVSVHDGVRTVFTAEKPFDVWEVTVTYPDGVRDTMDIHPAEIVALRSLLDQMTAREQATAQREAVAEDLSKRLFSGLREGAQVIRESMHVHA